MKETLKIVTEYEINFKIEYAIDEMLKSLEDDLNTWTDGYHNCIDVLPQETKEHLRDEILKEVIRRF